MRGRRGPRIFFFYPFVFPIQSIFSLEIIFANFLTLSIFFLIKTVGRSVIGWLARLIFEVLSKEIYKFYFCICISRCMSRLHEIALKRCFLYQNSLLAVLWLVDSDLFGRASKTSNNKKKIRYSSIKVKKEPDG